jgi:hypothetical protein
MKMQLEIKTRKIEEGAEGYRGLDTDIVAVYEKQTFVLNGRSSFGEKSAFLDFCTEEERQENGLNDIVAHYDYTNVNYCFGVSGFDESRNGHPIWYKGYIKKGKISISDSAREAILSLRESP